MDEKTGLVPEEAIEKATQACATACGRGDVSSLSASDQEYFRKQATAALAAAPLILAAYRKALLADAFPAESANYLYGCERLLELVRDGIPPAALGVREDGE
jgi:hypothetical protein